MVVDVDMLLLDVLYQACGDGDGEIDNKCLSAYEEACDYLKKKGLLQEVNSRIFNLSMEHTICNHWWKCKLCDKEYEFKSEMISHFTNFHLNSLMEECSNGKRYRKN